MANEFVNFLVGAADGSGNLRDYQHASRLYVSGTYELAPKVGWLYYVVLNINPAVSSAIRDPNIKKQFDSWQSAYNGTIGLLVKDVDLPKFTIETETMNQYNKKTIIQKQIKYSPIGFTFHDDNSNATTELWKQYYQYYYADSVYAGPTSVPLSILPKYTDSKYATSQSRFGLNNKQTIPFFISIDVFQLHKQHYTSFKLVNPMIKEWAHDKLDQTQTKTMTSRMSVEFETVIYDTNPGNRITSTNPGFQATHYDNTPSPLSVGGVGTVSILGEGGLLAGADDIFGDLANIDNASPLDLLNTVFKTNNLIKNAKSVSTDGLMQEGYSILNGTLGNISSSNAGVVNLDGTVSLVPAADRIIGGVGTTVNGISQAFSSVGIKLSGATSRILNNNITTATPKQ